jgi:hypothetical protein
VKKFERIWFEFEKKRLFEKEFEKEKKKKQRNPPLLSGPAAHLSYPAAARHPPLLSLFSADADDWAPPVSLSPSPFLSSSSPRHPADPAPPQSLPRPVAPPLSLPLSAAN